MMINYGILNIYDKDHFQQKIMHVGSKYKINNDNIYLMLA